ncbi:hypothetical protein IW261DRAFT_1618773 [Armillaria novae-zelandiae]|uniref:Uncharacterized protein n=1 Tax=Armillaria novae-zelandiae TaxID=153914 RepID=A0AA39PUH1_9AGAR|nr:hypothetical protein IW261DRAFT_1618773 [Armillaria novae-zelandiae]
MNAAAAGQSLAHSIRIATTTRSLWVALELTVSVISNVARRRHGYVWIHLQSRNQPSSRTLKHVLSTRGVGKGLDDESLDPAIKATGLVIFLHPYDGADSPGIREEKTTDTFWYCGVPFDC